MGFIHRIGQRITRLTQSDNQAYHDERQQLLLGKLLARGITQMTGIRSLGETEFRVFSQWGDDGIVQYLIHNVDIPHKTFIEFGVEDYRESNTRFLMMNDNWSGLVMDSSTKNIDHIRRSDYFWKYDLEATSCFINCENINALITEQRFDKQLGLLHIDLDGNDYWIWKMIDVVHPIIVIIEYNSVFGIDRAITIPYDEHFVRTKAHKSNLYFGASLRALHGLAQSKGYGFVGCNSAGNNAYFVRRDRLNDCVREVTLKDGYVLSKFRESRDSQGRLTYEPRSRRLHRIIGLPIYNVDTDRIECL